MAETSEDKDLKKFDAACRFIIKLGKVAHSYGPSSARLESYLARVTDALGYEGTFRCGPNQILFAFKQKKDDFQRIHLELMSGSGYDMAKLSYVGELVNDLAEEHISIEDAISRIEEIKNIPNPWGKLAIGSSFVMAGVGFAGLIAGSLWDLLFSALLSLLVYGLVLIASKLKGWIADGLPLISAYTVALLATILKLFIPEVTPSIVTLSAIIILIPGFTVSSGIVDLVSNQVASGTTNLMNGLVYLVKQFCGAWLGFTTVGLFFTLPQTIPSLPLNQHLIWVFLPLLFIGIVFVYQTLPRDFFWVLGCCVFAYFGVTLSSKMGGANFGTLFGAIIAGVYANLWAYKTKRPTSIVLIPAITILVSGSVGFRGLLVVAEGEMDKGLALFMQMFVVALSMAAGSLIVNSILRPKATL